MVAKVYDRSEMPEFRTLRVGARKKYPWFTTPSGSGFKFDTEVTLAGARSQVANAHRAVAPDGVERRYVVRIDVENNIWAIRIDGMPIEDRETWRKKAAVAQGHHPMSADDFASMNEAQVATVDVPGDAGPAYFDEDKI